MTTAPAALDVVVTARRAVADGIVLFDLAPAPGSSPLPLWQPGAHVDVRVGDGTPRQYSLCGTPGTQSWQIGVLVQPAGRGGSVWLHEHAELGKPLRVSRPRNHFAVPSSPTASTVYVAGGIGITPIIPMLDEASRSGADYRLHYAGRSRAAMALVDGLERRHPGRVQVYARDEGSRLDIPAVVASCGPRAQYVCCGPERMIEAMEAAASGLALHVERFAAAPAENGPVGQFVAELAASGPEVVVAPGCSLLDAIEGAGVWVLSSCNDGVCGTCETRVLSGNVDHRDSILTPAQRAVNDVMYICVSRGDGRLVLDL